MIRFIILALFSALCCRLAGQYEKGTRLLGAEIWLNSNNDNDPGVRSQKRFESSISLNAGKFIKENHFLSLLLISDFSRYHNVERDTSLRRVTTTEGRYFTLKPGIMWRRYFAATDKNIAGFVIQGLVSGGVVLGKWNYAAAYDGFDIFNNQNKSTKGTVESRFSFGVYVNPTSRWQLLLNMGNIYYNYLWGSETLDRNYTTYGASYGIEFNLASFRLTVNRFF